jgi:hypothetical protein
MEKQAFQLSFVRSPHGLEKKIIDSTRKIIVGTGKAKRYHGSTVSEINVASKDGLSCGNGKMVSPESKAFRQVKSAPSGHWSQGKDGPIWNDGIPLHEATEPVKVKRPSAKNPSAFKGKIWGECGNNVTIVRKAKKALAK